jgi:hypothetical protein
MESTSALLLGVSSTVLLIRSRSSSSFGSGKKLVFNMSTPTMGSTLGALFIGNLMAAVLYGVTCVQTFIYFQYSSRDAMSLRVTVFFLWICDTAHIAIMTYAVYFYVVTNFANPAALEEATLSVMIQNIITSISDITVRCVFARRLWILSGGNVPLAIPIVLEDIFQIFRNIVFVVFVFRERCCC